MFGNYIWLFIVSSMLTTCNALQQGSPSGLGIEPFSAIETALTTDSNTAKVQQLSTKIMISTGDPSDYARKTEVIDLEDSNVICEDLQDFPVELAYAVGANLASTPVICGGFFYDGSHQSSDKCFKYGEGGWQHFASMIEKRVSAAGIVYNNALHIFGGDNWDTSTTLQSSEIVKKDGSTTEGPQLPTPVYGHAIASINSTVSIITGGRKNSHTHSSDKTWYFNHASQEFQPGPNLLEARHGHSSGTVTDQETKEKMAIIAGGHGYLDSTERLVNGEWKTGKTQNQIFVHFCIPLLFRYSESINKFLLFLDIRTISTKSTYLVLNG